MVKHSIRGIEVSIRRCLTIALCAALVMPQSIYAVTSTELTKQKEATQKKQKETQKALDNIQSEMDDISGELSAVEEEAAQLDEELVGLLLSVDVLKEDIADKESRIQAAQRFYEDCKKHEETQYEAMKKRIKFMYEKGETDYMLLLLQAQSMADLINKVDYIEKLYDYDRQLLMDYQETKKKVITSKTELETDLEEMEELKEDLIEQEDDLKEILKEKRAAAESFSAQLAAAKKKAGSYKATIKAQADQIQQLEEESKKKKAEEEEAKRKQEEEAKKKLEEAAKMAALTKSNTEASGNNGEGQQVVQEQIPVVSEGSAKGQEIANYACQFVGNPYVYGGTSLTNGCDCSGFTMMVYKNFGINLPRTASQQATRGQEVSVADAQPGDIFYYSGHVGIYIGNGTIVHASTEKTGIKYSSAYYRTVLSVRRIV